MTPETSRTGTTDPKPAAERNQDGKTPNADMQPEDAGSGDSGVNDSATSAVGVMKQTSKTPAEQNRRKV